MPRTATKTSKSKSQKKKTTSARKYDAIRRELERQRALILDQANEALPAQSGTEAFPDFTDQASADIDKTFTLRLKEREQKLLKKIDLALNRMDSQTYGLCEHCGDEIPLQRLKARPVTTLCIACKTQQEQDEKSHH